MSQYISLVIGRAMLAASDVDLKKLLKRQEGQAMVEYALILFLVSVVAVTLLTTIGTKIKATFQSVVNAL
jgi:pilus assembly protein Flp/PilA